MATHFSTLGFHLTSPDDFPELAKRVAAVADHYPCPGGTYLHWRGDSGVELWVQVNEDGRFLDIQPHFAAMATMRIGLTERLPRPTDMPLDGTWRGWLDPLDDENPHGGRCLVTFEAPDFQLHHDLEIPNVVSVQMAAFAHSLSIFSSDEEFHDAPTNSGRLAAQTFIPAEQKVREGGETEPLKAEALVCGHILQARQLANDLTGLPFYWLLLETDGGRIDLLVDPELLTAQPVPQPGGVAMTLCWLSGRIL